MCICGGGDDGYSVMHAIHYLALFNHPQCYNFIYFFLSVHIHASVGFPFFCSFSIPDTCYNKNWEKNSS